jgi:hypothetical protein
MSALGFTDQRGRLRRILENSLEGAAYLSSETEEDGRMVVIRARRPDGQRVAVRFRAVSSSDASQQPEVGAVLRLHSVSVSRGGCLSLLSPFWLFRRGPGVPQMSDSARVRIDAGAARLDIVCQDAEWWEDAGTA